MQWLQRDVVESTPYAKNHPPRPPATQTQHQTQKWHENGLNKGTPLLLPSKSLLKREALMPFVKETPDLWLICDRKCSRTLRPFKILDPVEFYCWGWWKLQPINILCASTALLKAAPLLLHAHTSLKNSKNWSEEKKSFRKTIESFQAASGLTFPLLFLILCCC